jgi:hypothetical protein
MKNNPIRYYYVAAVLLLGGCTTQEGAQNTQQKADKPVVAEVNFSRFRGNWIEKKLLTHLKEKREIGQMPPISEIVFTSEYNDSIWLLSANAPTKTKIKAITADSVSFDQGGLSYDNTAGEVMIWIDKAGKSHLFERVGDGISANPATIPAALPGFIHQFTLTGDYFLMDKKGKKTEDFIFFRKDGAVVGLENYKQYEVCYTPSSKGKYASTQHVVRLITDTGSDFFEWEFKNYDEENDKPENKGKKPKNFGISLILEKLGGDSPSAKPAKKTAEKSDKSDGSKYELSVQKLG